jgi:hypothetical protein
MPARLRSKSVARILVAALAGFFVGGGHGSLETIVQAVLQLNTIV